MSIGQLKRDLAKVECCKNEDEQLTSKSKLLRWLLVPENGTNEMTACTLLQNLMRKINSKKNF